MYSVYVLQQFTFGNNRVIWPFTLVILQITQNKQKSLLFQVSYDRFKKLSLLFVLVSERTNATTFVHVAARII